jgi:hypothetical protein
MALGKIRLGEPRVASALVLTGAAGTALVHGAAIPWGASAPWQDATGPWWASLEPHSSSPFEMVGNTCVALLVIGVCLWIARPLPVLLPALALGSMSLSVYTAHVVVIAIAGDSIVWDPSNVALVALTFSLMAAATVWRVLVGPGPLERVLTSVSTRAADVFAGSR